MRGEVEEVRKPHKASTATLPGATRCTEMSPLYILEQIAIVKGAADTYQCMFGVLVQNVLDSIRLHFPQIYANMLISDDFKHSVCTGKLRGDEKPCAKAFLVEAVISQMQTMSNNNTATDLLEQHMSNITTTS